MSIPDSIAALVERFEAERKEYHQGHYNETQTRIDYVNPLFAALGWDMNNQEGLSEPLREVVHEDALKIGGTTKAPDYSFRLGGARKFFLETKKPSVSVDLKEEPAYQLRRYAWTAKLPVSILTNFEEFAVYDGRVPPDRKDSPKKARLDYFKFTDYAARWDDIVARFSKEAVLSGAFDRYAEEAREKRLSLPVDAAFLAQISGWREKLARSILQKNTGLAPRELNYAVQMIIDRIIFLRISEDRGIEPTHLLQPLLNNGGPVYPRLLDIFRHADARYNSGLFHFDSVPGREGPDDITPGLTLDDRPLKEIIASIYYPESPFEFSVFPADILGHVYEQFLGKVIHVSGKTAVVEDKPEVKKAGGVYYTPTYIVDYIVRNTLGKLVAGKTPAQVAKLTVLDPACGSGSFLIGAYQFLLDWHLRYYTENDRAKWARGKNAVIYPFRRDAEGGEQWRLTTAEKKRILLQNIYGVDIDTQAVEVTKLSLLLKVLENESAELIDNTLKFFHERALPDLESNIKCGNSLIAPDFYDGKDPAQFDLDARLKINAFDWPKAFPAVMKAGGFDAVIGNPPYGAEMPESTLEYLKAHFVTFVWRGESYLTFIEQATKLMKIGGQFSYIIPDTYLNLGFTQTVRTLLLQNTKIQEIVALPSRVFEAAVVDTTLLFAERVELSTTFHETFVTVKTFNKVQTTNTLDEPTRQFEVSTKEWHQQNAFNLLSDTSELKLLAAIESKGVRLSEVAEMFYGIKAYQVGKGKPAQTRKIVDTKPFTSHLQEDDSYSPFFDGKHIGRYELLWRENNWLKYGSWLAEPRQPEKYEGEKILIRKIVGETLVATYIPTTSYCNTLLSVLKIKPDSELKYQYLLGILNSKLIGWYFKKKFQISSEDTFPQILIRDILQFALPNLNKAKHDKMVSLVERMLTLHKDKAAVRLVREKAMLEQEIAGLDAQIDRLVYDLYGLTAEEIAVVEGAG